MRDCYFNDQNQYFRYRSGGIIIADDKMLFVKNSNEDYYYMVGGGVHLGETSAQAAEREIAEETGIIAKAERLAAVFENFFEENGRKHHNLEYYYLMKIVDDSALKASSDIDEELVFLPLENLSEYDIRPSFIKQNINEMINGNAVMHGVVN